MLFQHRSWLELRKLGTWTIIVDSISKCRKKIYEKVAHDDIFICGLGTVKDITKNYKNIHQIFSTRVPSEVASSFLNTEQRVVDLLPYY